jgi:hypothetical protein
VAEKCATFLERSGTEQAFGVERKVARPLTGRFLSLSFHYPINEIFPPLYSSKKKNAMHEAWR